MDDPRYDIGLATKGEVALLPEIEHQASVVFESVPETANLPELPTDLEDFEAAQRAGLLWVARTAGRPVGFALTARLGDALHLEELDVLPAHGRRGVGTRLVQAVCGHAAARGLPVTLTTFRKLPWNEPFYARLGFRELADDQLSPALRACVDEELASGLPAALRIVMIFDGRTSSAGSPDP